MGTTTTGSVLSERLKTDIAQMLSLHRKPVIEGWTTQEKAEVLASLIVEHKPKLLVEVGVFGGRSLFAQGLALREAGAGVIYGVDPWSLDAVLEGDIGDANAKWWTENLKLEDIYIGFIRAVLDLHLTRECRWIRERGEVAARMFAEESIDVLHLDANHSEFASCREVECWHTKVKPGGFVVADDVDWPTVAKSLQLLLSLGFKTVTGTTQFSVFQKHGAP